MRRNSGRYHKVKTSGNLIKPNGTIIVEETYIVKKRKRKA